VVQHFDLTLIAQVISLLVLGLLIYAFIFMFKFIRNKRKSDKEILKKQDRIIELLEENGKNS
jgi:uncharacterized membrane protein